MPRARGEHMAHAAHQQAMRAAAAHLGRRRFLTVTGAAAALAFSTNLPSARAAQVRTDALSEDPFTLGVASGDPLPDAVVLWTRLAPRAFEPGNGLPEEGAVQVGGQLARREHL